MPQSAKIIKPMLEYMGTAVGTTVEELG